MSRFPNLFVIGAMKAGTSSLHWYLQQHPAIFMSRFKEPQYFAPHRTRWGEKWGQGNPYPEPGMDWYLRLFDDAGDVKYAGESSVSYTARPWVCGCETRIHAFNPEARLVYLMRDPIERTISHYWQFVADGREDRDPLSAIRHKREYIARSHYAMQLRPYLDTFGSEQVFALTLEELDSDPQETFRRLFNWLGVASDVPIDNTVKHHVSAQEVKQTRRFRVCLDTLRKHWRWRQIASHVPRFVHNQLDCVTYRQVKKVDVDLEPAINYLRPILQAHTRELVELLQRGFTEWTKLHGAPPSAPSFVNQIA